MKVLVVENGVDGIKVEYSETSATAEGITDGRFVCISNDQPKPELYKAWHSLKPFICDICGFPPTFSEKVLHLKKVAISYHSEAKDVRGIAFSGIIATDAGEAKFASPKRYDKAWNDLTRAGKSWIASEELIKAIVELEEQAKQYVLGNRIQVNLFAGDKQG